MWFRAVILASWAHDGSPEFSNIFSACNVNKELAIIIPAYKTRFLAKALASVSTQTAKNFQIYVFDDGSPNPVKAISHDALMNNGDNWVYQRFDLNLGGSALTKHYDRCVKSTKEPWIWLFADDDIMEEGCVAACWKTIQETAARYDVYCFDSIDIDSYDRVVALHPLLPDWESWKQFAYFFFSGDRVVPQQAMVFSRVAYKKLGAFVEFPVGWASDQATLMALAGENGIKQIPGPKVRSRRSGENISSVGSAAISSKKLQATMQFMRWAVRQIDEVPDQNFPMSDESLRSLTFEWFKQHLAALHTWYGPSECLQTASFMKETWSEPYGRSLARMLKLNVGMVLNELRVRFSRVRR